MIFKLKFLKKKEEQVNIFLNCHGILHLLPQKCALFMHSKKRVLIYFPQTVK
jgi:hypothetical protein